MRTTRRNIQRAVRAALAVMVLGVVVTALADHQSPGQALAYWGNTLHVHPYTPYAIQDESGVPARPYAWAACSTVTYQVSYANAPANAPAVLAHALRVTSAATGLRFVAASGTAPAGGYPSYPALAVSRSLPVVFAWSGAPTLFGLGNVNAVTEPVVDATTHHYVGAEVLFSTSVNHTFTTDPAFALNLVLHELGHVLGLADIDNPTQIMNTTLVAGTTVSSFGSGDLAGFAALGYHRCG